MLKNIISWNRHRKIPKVFDTEAEVKMLDEEVHELLLAKTDSDRVDALADLVVIAVGGMWKLGFDPEHAMNEVLKEIGSRRGSFDTESGKWIKEITGKEYTARYAKEITGEEEDKA